MGYRDVVIVPEKKLFFCVVSDMNPISRVDSYLTNMNMPWDKTKDQVLLSVGVLEAWLQTKKGIEEYTYEKLWYKNFKSQAICIHYNPTLKIICAGCDNGTLVTLSYDVANPLKYKEVSEEKVHSKRLMGMWSESRRKMIYSIGEDGMLKVFDMNANKVTHEIQVSSTKLTCMVTDDKTGFSLIADKNGTVFCYDLADVNTISIYLKINFFTESSKL